MNLALWRCCFDAGGTTYAGVMLHNGATGEISVLVGERLYSRDDQLREYPGASRLQVLTEPLGVRVVVTEDEWCASSEVEKAALVYRQLEAREVRS